MIKRYSTFIAFIISFTGIFAQSWETVGSNFLSSGDIATNLQVLSYQDTAFVAYADMNVAKLKKRSGNNWLTVVSQNTENNFFKLIYGTDNKPYFITLSRGASIISVGSTGFFADIHEYDNGSLTLVESREMQFVPSGTNMGLDVSNFDFTMRENGDMAGIIRYPSAARSVYNVKIGNNPWATETVYYETIGGTIGNAIEKSNIAFFDEGVMILSRLFNQSLGAAHLFFHDNTSSSPTSSILNGGSFSVANSSVNPMSVTSRADTVYMAYSDNSNIAQFRKFYHESTATEPLASEHMQTLGSEVLGMHLDFTSSNNYLSYIEQNSSTFEMNAYVNDLSSNYAISEGQAVAGSPFSLGELVVSPQVMRVNPSNGEIYVAYIHGPPMVNSIVRKFGCGPVAAAYDALGNELSITSSYSSSASFEWTTCGETTVLSTDDTFEPTEDGDYQVTVTDGACETTSNCVAVQIEDDALSLSKVEKNVLILFPNPSTGKVLVEGESLIGGQLNVLDLTGNVVHAETLRANITSVDLSSLSKGVYVFNITAANANYNQKVIIK